MLEMENYPHGAKRQMWWTVSRESVLCACGPCLPSRKSVVPSLNRSVRLAPILIWTPASPFSPLLDCEVFRFLHDVSLHSSW